MVMHKQPGTVSLPSEQIGGCHRASTIARHEVLVEGHPRRVTGDDHQFVGQDELVRSWTGEDSAPRLDDLVPSTQDRPTRMDANHPITALPRRNHRRKVALFMGLVERAVDRAHGLARCFTHRFSLSQAAATAGLGSPPMSRLAGTRVLVTSADSYMGPAITELFISEGADVAVDTGALLDPEEPAALVERAGAIDVLIANLDLPASNAKVVAIEDEDWLEGFDAMVHPLMRLVRAATPGMIERGGGSIVAITSSSPLRRMSPQAVAYVTARAAQNAFVRSAGHQLAKQGIRLNAVAQNFVANDVYYPPAVLANEKFQARLATEVPAARIGEPVESAELALFLASEASSFIFGQIISQDGGWS